MSDLSLTRTCVDSEGCSDTTAGPASAAVSDSDLMRRVCAGQAECFGQLVARYERALRRVAVSKLGHVDWAEDVVQETFLAAFHARDSFNPEYSFRTWLWTILLNLCRRQWKRAARRQELVETVCARSPEQQPGEPVSHVNGLDVLVNEERRELLAGLLQELPEVQADALRLRFYGHLTFAEVAATMDSSLGAAKQRVKKGLMRLSELVRERGGDLANEL